MITNLEEFKKSIDDNTELEDISEDLIDDKFYKIIDVVKFNNTLTKFKGTHVKDPYVEPLIVSFINSLCGVDDWKLNDNELINADQEDIKQKISTGIYSFYSPFGLKYDMFNQIF